MVGGAFLAQRIAQLIDAEFWFTAERGIPVRAVMHQAFDTCSPAQCPLCAAGTPLERVA